MTWGARAIAGALVVVLLAGVSYVGARVALGAYEPSYPIHVVLGQVGQNVTSGSEVKVRGVIVGRVGEISLDDELRAVAELIIQPQYRIPDRSSFAVTGKTLLGEKQVEVRFEGPFDQGPFIPPGAIIADADRVVEFQDVLAELSELFDAIDPDDLAVVVNDGLGAFDDQAPQIARAVDQGARATDVGVRNLDDQVVATRDLSLLADRLASEGDEFNALGSETLRGLPVLSDNQLQTREVLRTLSRFSAELDATLEIDRANFDRMVVHGDSVTRMLFVYAEELGEVLSGLTNYTSQYVGGGFENPTIQGQAAYFEIFIDSGIQSELCPELPPELSENLPLCTGRDPVELPVGSGGQTSHGSGRVPLAALEVPHQMVQPDRPRVMDLRALLELRAGIAEEAGDGR